MATQTRPRIPAEPRVRVRKKSDLKFLRRSGEIPATLFGHGEPQHIKVNARAMDDFLRRHAASGIVDVELESRPTPALLREIDRDPISDKIIHLGFQRVDLRETIKATVPVTFSGEDELIGNDLVLQRQIENVQVVARAEALPEMITVDVSRAEAGHSIRIGDLEFPDGVEATMDPELPIASITHPSVPAEVEAALDAEELAHAELVASHAAEATEAEEETAEEAEAPAA